MHGVSRVLNRGTEQLLNYLTVSGVEHGILFIPPISHNEAMEVTKLARKIGDVSYSLVQIYPKKRLNKSMQQTANAAAD